MSDLGHLKSHLSGKAVILGIGNTLHNDDAAGSLLASRIRGKVPYIVYDAASSPENFLGKIVKDAPENIVIIDAADFGLGAGEFRVLEPSQIKTTNLFSTHNASISLAIDYLKNNLRADIIVLVIQPKDISFGDILSTEVANTLNYLEKWFCEPD